MRASVWVLLVLANALGGSSYMATAYALKDFSPIGAVFWRMAAGAAIFAPFLIRGVLREELGRREWLGMAAVGVFGYAAPLVLGTVGQGLSSATNASLLVNVEPVSVVLLSAVFLGESLTGRKIAALLLCLGGAAMICLQGIPGWSRPVSPHFTGDAILFMHGFLWSLYTVIGKPVLRRTSPLTFTAATTVFAFIPLAASALWTGAGPLRSPASARSLAALAYLGVGSGALAMWAWNEALERIPASQLASFIFLQPILGVSLGVLALKDKVSAWTVLGGSLILLGVYWSAKAGSSSEFRAAAELPSPGFPPDD